MQGQILGLRKTTAGGDAWNDEGIPLLALEVVKAMRPQ
jgi:hypothetical protein